MKVTLIDRQPVTVAKQCRYDARMERRRRGLLG